MSTRNRRWSEADLAFLKINYPKYGMDYCMKSLDRTYESILNKIYYERITLNSDVRRNIRIENVKKNILNHGNVDVSKFLNIKTKEVAYILGYLWADGYIYNGRIVLEAVSKDVDNVLHIFNFVGKWTISSRKRVGCKPTTKIEFYSKTVFDFLVNMGYRSKSGGSPRKILEAIPKNLHHYWYLGYYDGDGCIFEGPKAYNITVASTYNQDWDFIKELYKKLKIKFCVRQAQTKKGSYSTIVVNSSYVYPLLEY